MRPTALLTSLALFTAPAFADTVGTPAGDMTVQQAKTYSDCMSQARRMPDQALRSAQAWAQNGGGVPAGHCAAVALIGLGRYQEAADSMERLGGQELATRKDLAAGLFGQAAQAWVLANDNDRAIKDQTAALTLTPDDPELLIDRGVMLASIAKYREAIDDFSKAHQLANDRADILVLRATAYRMAKSLDLARQDIEQAIKLEPKNPDAFLERGILRKLGNDKAGAKADWQKTLALGPGSPAAETAGANLKQLDQPVQPAQPQ
jgi:tetratricopeptide (TPR) repeat protein